MKYGAHCYLFTPRWTDEDVRFLDLARELGLDMFELSVGDDVVFDPRLTARRAAALGLALITGPGGLWPLDADLSSDDSGDRSRGLAWHKRQVDLTAELGAWAYAGCLYGHPGIVKRRRPPADELLRAAEGLHALAEHAAARGVTLVLARRPPAPATCAIIGPVHLAQHRHPWNPTGPTAPTSAICTRT